jgi:hypothetical protein
MTGCGWENCWRSSGRTLISRNFRSMSHGRFPSSMWASKNRGQSKASATRFTPRRCIVELENHLRVPASRRPGLCEPTLQWSAALLAGDAEPLASATSVKAACIQGRIGWHTSRHTYATLLKANGEDVKTVQELLRHSNSLVTMNLYAQAVTEAKGAEPSCGHVVRRQPRQNRALLLLEQNGRMKKTFNRVSY